MRQPPSSTIATWGATILRALEAQGLDAAAIAAAAGIDPVALQEPDARISRASLTRLWQLAVEATGDPCFGLTVARFPMQTTFHALGYAVLASSTLREGLERVIRFRRLIGDIIQLSLEDHGDAVRFVIDVTSQPGAVPFEAVDAVAAVLVGQARVLQGQRDFRPLSISLRRPEPETSAPFSRVFRCPIRFEQSVNYLEFARADLDRRLPSGNAELARQNEEVVVRYLARLPTADVAGRVREAIVGLLPNGAPGKQAVARQLAMSPRNLQRHLAAEGTSFKELLAEARIELAGSYLKEGRLRITEIAFMLGFADTSAFSRAFKRWTGRSPRDFPDRG